MKIKVSEASGAVLDWLVAKCGGIKEHDMGSFMCPIIDAVLAYQYAPSSHWSQGGPIIEREQIIATLERLNGGSWRAQAPYDRAQDRPGPYYYGSTPLIAAMRCYVTSKLGDEVDVPEVLA